MKYITSLLMLLVSFTGYAQLELPINFDSMSVTYILTDFGGNASSVVADPTDPNNNVAQSIKTDVAELWAGTTMGANELANPIPFTANDTKMTVRVWSPDAGTPIRLKVEDATDPTKSVETEANTTMAMAWETLEFDFSNEASGTAPINLTYTYDKISIFFNFGTDGMTAGEKTYYWDDVEFAGGGGPTQVDLPITFEDDNVDYNLTDFGGNASAVETDPTDPNNKVGRATKTGTAELWAGTTMGDSGLANPIPFTADDTKITVRVWSPDAGIPVRLKVEDVTDPTKSVETEANTTMAMAWETLEFDFSNEASGTAPINLTYTYDKISIFFNFGTDGMTAGEKTYYWDDVMFVLPPPLDQVDLPITFEDDNVDYNLTDFGGNASSIETDPTDPSNKVGKAIKTGGAEIWAGTTMGDSGLANPIPFSNSSTKITVRVWSPDAGTPIRLKAEDVTDPTISVETEINTTAAMDWETLEFDFSNEVSGTAALDLTKTYDKLSIFFNFGTDGATAGEKTYYWDDVQFVSLPPLDQIDLPVTFEEANTDYTLSDFGGNASMVVTDPTDPNNTVAQSIKTGAAETWAGTTMGTSLGFANPIPFTADETKMKVRIWSPDAGTPIRLKVEDATDPTISVETESTVLVAMEWHTIEFDFSDEVSGTAPLDLTKTYDKASIFFNFGTDGATAGEKTYYWDDVEFGGLYTVVDIIFDSEDHDTLAVALLAAGFDGPLEDPGPFTIFAPTDDAFAALPDGVLDDLLADPMGDLSEILRYHVLNGRVLSSDLSDGQMAPTLQGENITVTINGDDIFINDDAQVTVADLIADNGVVHVIDAVLLPPSFVGVETLNAADYNIKIAPNPANSYFYIEFPEAVNEEVLITLFDVNGKVLKQERIQDQWSEINTSNLNTGSYYLKIDTQDASFYQKVMIVK